MKTKSTASHSLAGKACATPAAAPSEGSEGNCCRKQMIAEGAYFRAEKRGFVPGQEMSDWLQAESDVERMLAQGG